MLPGVLNWESPWDKPSYVHEQKFWAITEFSRENLTDDYIGVYDATNQAVFALKFADLPSSGIIGVLASDQIDKVVLDYQFAQINPNQPASVSYQLLTFAESSYPEKVKTDQLKSLFDFKPASVLDLEFRSYVDYIQQNKIDFLVYSVGEFDSNILRSGKLQLVYSNDGYVICRVKCLLFFWESWFLSANF